MNESSDEGGYSVRYAVNTITPPANYPVETDDMMNFLKMDYSNPALARERQFIEDLIAGATTLLELYTGRAFMTQTLEMVLKPRLKVIPKLAGLTYAYEALPGLIKLYRPPCQEVTGVCAVEQDGTTHAQPDDSYVVNIETQPAELQLVYGAVWIYYIRGYYRIQYTAGYGDTIDKVPPLIRQAVRLTVAQWYGARELHDYSLPTLATDLVQSYRIEAGEL
jgi:hypothetical protein